ncbi:ABC transporter substrate-binding protein [Kibdelosporangium persicum]|uniref:ABC-type nitrate/sulfonate/bicarbonate transport system, periplasmic component n=1 Tax=Kibdelosporangium persicum TaxID=2698649 RepID=A0ABX2EVL0_9PSEU|nr:ABC transporter substrate-binding protein [Kibdelosporangium persicum]NRN63071.1 ABC-type nitrate/sulfonate/bicarbonate transport system, periplasmic component [Kibdelosporangium persicum]
MPLRGLVAGLLVVTLAGCGLMGSPDQETPATGRLERTVIKVGSLGIVDSAPLHLAIDNGYFAAEGLEVRLTTGAKGSANVDNVLGGSLDFGLTSYPPALMPQVKGVANLKIVADAVQTTENLILCVVPDNSTIRKPVDLAGKKIAVSSKRGISELTLNSQLKMMSVDHKTVEYISMEIASMPSALHRGDVAAAVIAEPHLTAATKEGLVKLIDPFSGPTANFPWSGWIAKKEFTDANPNVVAAFKRALNKGVAQTGSRDQVGQVLAKHLKIDSNTYQLMTMPVFPTTVDPARLQRVADLMLEQGEIDKPLDMRTMMLETPS